jgi:hypothetical protein
MVSDVDGSSHTMDRCLFGVLRATSTLGGHAAHLLLCGTHMLHTIRPMQVSYSLIHVSLHW